MTVELTGWSRRLLADRSVRLASPDRDLQICIAPHVRPVRSLAAWFVELSRTIEVLRSVRSCGDIRELVTDAGEYAQRVSLETASARWALGLVAGDDELVTILASGRRGDPTSLVDELLRVHVTPWASERVRMYRHAAPAGWFGTRELWATVWYSATRARIVACDAIPRASTALATRDLVWPTPAGAAAHTEAVTGRVHGTLATWAGGAAVADLTTGPFAIRLHLLDGDAGDLAALRAMIASVEPLTESASPPPAVLDWMVT